MADPRASASEALELLAARQIPEGYEIKLVLKVLFYVGIVTLEGDRRSFIYFDGLRTNADLGAAEIRFALYDGRLAFDADADAAGFSILDFDLSEVGEATKDRDDEPDLGAVILVRCSERVMMPAGGAE